jgi:hypothetical protein
MDAQAIKDDAELDDVNTAKPRISGPSPQSKQARAGHPTNHQAPAKGKYLKHANLDQDKRHLIPDLSPHGRTDLISPNIYSPVQRLASSLPFYLGGH